MLVPVTQEHIDRAVANRAKGDAYNTCRECVLAVACSDAYGRPMMVSTAWTHPVADGPGRMVRMPDEAIKYRQQFDYEPSKPLQPTTFEFPELPA